MPELVLKFELDHTSLELSSGKITKTSPTHTIDTEDNPAVVSMDGVVCALDTSKYKVGDVLAMDQENHGELVVVSTATERLKAWYSWITEDLHPRDRRRRMARNRFIRDVRKGWVPLHATIELVKSIRKNK